MSIQFNFSDYRDENSDKEENQFLSFRNDLPQKLRLLSFAAKNRDFHEVGFIAHHIHQIFERIGASHEQAMAFQLTKASLMQPTEAEQKVIEFTEHLMTVVRTND